MHFITTIIGIDDVSEDLRERLEQLTHGRVIGQMAWRLGDAYKGGSEWIVTARPTNSEMIVGWALAFMMYGHANLHVFVDPPFRQRGVGVALVGTAVGKMAPLHVTVQSDAAARLFDRFEHWLVITDERQR